MSKEVRKLNAEVGVLRSENRDPGLKCNPRRNSSRAELDTVPEAFELAGGGKID